MLCWISQELLEMFDVIVEFKFFLYMSVSSHCGIQMSNAYLFALGRLVVCLKIRNYKKEQENYKQNIVFGKGGNNYLIQTNLQTGEIGID